MEEDVQGGGCRFAGVWVDFGVHRGTGTPVGLKGLVTSVGMSPRCCARRSVQVMCRWHLWSLRHFVSC